MVQHTNAGDNMDLSVNVSVVLCVCTHDMCIAVWKYKMTSWDNFNFYYNL